LHHLIGSISRWGIDQSQNDTELKVDGFNSSKAYVPAVVPKLKGAFLALLFKDWGLLKDERLNYLSV
jgi:hypothetical protein